MIPMLSVEDARKAGVEAGINEEMATLNAFRALMNSPAAAGAAAGLLRTLMYRNKLDARLRELIILRTGWRTGSEYEFCQHAGVSRGLGMTNEEILGVRDPDACKAYSEIDRAVIRMADELHERAEITPATWSALERKFSPGELVELVLVSGFWRMMAGFLKTSGIPIDPVDPTFAGWPEGRKPF